MIVRLQFAEVQWTENGCLSTFNDGSSYCAHPHDLPHYHAIAHRLGYEGDILRFAREHEVAHHLVAEVFGQPSHVLWPLANGHEPDAFAAAAEEALAMALQRYARANEVPLIDRIDWRRLRDRFLSVLKAPD